jgi:hypothetical protein
LLIFLGLRIAYAYFLGWKQITIGDALSYNNYALAILGQQDWLTNPAFPGDYRAPAYPLFLALIYKLFGPENFLAVYISQAIISVLTAYYIYRLSASLFGDKPAFLAMLWAGCYVFYIWHVGMLYRENLIFFLMIFSFYELWMYLRSKRRVHSLRSSRLWKFLIAFAILVHTDARYLFYLPFFSVLFLTYGGFWSGLRQYAWAMGIFAVLLVPWTVRNYVAYDGFVLINTRTLDLRGLDKRDPIAAKRLDALRKTRSITQSTGVNKNEIYPDEEERSLIMQGMNPNKRPIEEIDAIRDGARPASAFPARKWYWLVSLWRPAKFKGDYLPYPTATFEEKWSQKHNVAGIVSYGLLLPFMLYGIFRLIRERRTIWVFLVLPIVVQTLLHVLLWARNRYRMPIDSFVIILAMFGFYCLYHTLRRGYSVEQSEEGAVP